jgi:CRISPR-associated protein Csm2
MVIDKETAKKILDKNLDRDGNFLFKNSEELAKYISEYVNSTQLRKYFGEVKKISENEETFKYEIKRFLAIMLYSVARSIKKYNKEVLENFSKSITNMVQVVSEGDLNYLKRFKDFFEAVVAYYKFYNPNSK